MSDVSKSVQKVVAKHGGRNFEFSRSDKEAHDLWQGRKAALWSVLALKEDARVWTTDVWWVHSPAGLSVSASSLSRLDLGRGLWGVEHPEMSFELILCDVM
jgi:hypothetical protein